MNLANNMSYAFETPSGIPHNNLIFSNRGNDGSRTNGLATAGTLVLEWTRLSDLTGNETYAQLTQKAEGYLLSPQPASSEPWPGLVGTNIDINSGRFVDASGGWNGGTDSFYEYLIKVRNGTIAISRAPLTLNVRCTSTTPLASTGTKTGKPRNPHYPFQPLTRPSWILAADSSIDHLASHPVSRPDLTFLAAYNNRTLSLSSGHLACFDGGNFILGGLVLGSQRYIDFGLELVAGCEATYNSTLTGIGPEGFGWDSRRVPADQREFYEEAGFYITSAGYQLRPEVLESFYYAWRATGDRKYQDVRPSQSLAFPTTDQQLANRCPTVVLRRLPRDSRHHARRQRVQQRDERERRQRRLVQQFPGILLLR